MFGVGTSIYFLENLAIVERRGILFAPSLHGATSLANITGITSRLDNHHFG
jgi:hypothetical protein